MAENLSYTLQGPETTPNTPDRLWWEEGYGGIFMIFFFFFFLPVDNVAVIDTERMTKREKTFWVWNEYAMRWRLTEHE